MSKIDDLEKEIMDIKNNQAIADGIKKGIHVRCVAVWSVVLAFLTFIGKMTTDNSDILKAAVSAAWEVWKRK